MSVHVSVYAARFIGYTGVATVNKTTDIYLPRINLLVCWQKLAIIAKLRSTGRETFPFITIFRLFFA